MALREELKRQGSRFFMWRSYLPLILFPILLIALKETEYIEKLFGDFADDLWEIFCIGVSFLGLFFRCITIGYVPKGTSGRNTKQQIADRLNTTGIYSVVRNPLYLGNFLIMLGFVMFTQEWWAIVIAILVFWIYYERIIYAEEEFLREKFGNIFLQWAESTPAFIPKLTRWQKPDLPLSFRNILKREYTGFFVIIIIFTFLEIVGDFISEGTFEFDIEWIIFFITGLVVYFTLRTLKKKTKILHVQGR